ncbi:hypothetical protein BDB00DRAFT_622712 [Zychaea mexicana]|uniref:uncharacterized protein n=1 Tax=Zychaea mexicana TaxID=64656 RepID=UPI0022FE50EB|nr:uncharacterized protein BDB00DRAFT_622712 [Zychaea mexicana]KAI9497416.1 hypothetical protein BDB00DRAFT_622712 [Zychaea mexicana]
MPRTIALSTRSTPCCSSVEMAAACSAVFCQETNNSKPATAPTTKKSNDPPSFRIRPSSSLPSSVRYFYTQAPCIVSFSNERQVPGGAHVVQQHPLVNNNDGVGTTTDYAALANSIRAQHDIPSVPRVHDLFAFDEEVQEDNNGTLDHHENHRAKRRKDSNVREGISDSGDGAGDGGCDDQQQQQQEQRDYRRRRKTYRVKVSKHRSATEIQRQLVQAYMQEFE